MKSLKTQRFQTFSSFQSTESGLSSTLHRVAVSASEVIGMSELAQKAASMLDMLPVNEQQLAYEMLKRIVLAWDPDFTKLTPAEAEALRNAEAEIERGETVSGEEIDWDAD